MENKKVTVLGMTLFIGSLVLFSGWTGGTGFGRSIEDVDLSMDMNVGTSSYSIIGEGTEDGFGYAVAGGGDLNGDGCDDLVVGSPYHDSSGMDINGKVHIYFGGNLPLDRPNNRTQEDASFIGSSQYDDLGMAISIDGDLNGDGYDDLVARDYYSPGETHGSSVHIVFGKRSGWEREVSISSSDVWIYYQCTGYAIWRAECEGDLNGDGYDDLVITLPYDTDYRGKAYIFFGRGSEWSSSLNLTDADTIITDSEMGSRFGVGVAFNSDLNGDSIDDLVIGASQADHGGNDRGSAYLFFGKDGHWPGQLAADDANGTFHGETDSAMAGYDVASGGDINGDGFDDLLIGAPLTRDPLSNMVGRSYLVLGRKSGWTSSFDLSGADASFTGVETYKYFSLPSCIPGDVNGDGLDDILLSAIYAGSDNSNIGRVYLFYGRADIKGDHLNASVADASFFGERGMDRLGHCCESLGDMNGDGRRSEFAISTPYNDEGGTEAGKVYLFLQSRNDPPTEVISLELYRDEACSIPMIRADRGEPVYIELTGTDGNATSRDSTWVNVSLDRSMPTPKKVLVKETGTNTGVYMGVFTVPSLAVYSESLIVSSVNRPNRMATLTVETPILLGEAPDKVLVHEKEILSLIYRNVGYSTEQVWSFETDADWLRFDQSTHSVLGTPHNDDVGKWNVKVILSDLDGHTDSASTEVTVVNIPPVITTCNVLTAVEDIPYIVDYSCDEDPEGAMVWGITTNASWLEMISDAGILRGTPGNKDVGDYWVRVWVDDGKSGTTASNFNLTVTNTNDPPTIISPDITVIDQGARYINTYEAEDPDRGDVLTWTLESSADWLWFNGSELSGRPGPEDIGTSRVEITVTDMAGESDSRSFDLEVRNINDLPRWVDVPVDVSIINGREYAFDVNATDLDPGTELVYSVSSLPISDISIDGSSGVLAWSASIALFKNPPYVLKVKVTVTDGTAKVEHSFRITVILSGAPISTIVSPDDGSRVPFRGSYLQWTGSDPDNDPIRYDIYIGENNALVSVLNEGTVFLKGFDGTKLGIEGLSSGKTYYWTVVPSDGSSTGKCSNRIWSFTLNSPPVIKDIDVLQVTAGTELKVFLKVTDNDPEDKGAIVYSLDDAPCGMTIGGDTGMIRWVPSDDQVMLHKVTAKVNDSIETAEIVIMIEVGPGKESPSKGIGPIIGAIAGGSLLLIAASVAVVIVIRRKGSSDDDSPDNMGSGTGSPKENPVSVQKNLCSVPLDATEAHRNDQSSKAPMSYEDLYGMPPLDKEEGMTTSELRDYIKGTIQELEKMEIGNEDDIQEE